jgi:glycosyltransferase involved in cell wall biosynthesis
MTRDRELIERVKADKACRQASPFRYRDRSPLAFIVHSYNRVSNVGHLVDGLRRMGDYELIVCDDGSIDGSREKWLADLGRPNDFLINSNDIHEIRILDRAIRFASANIVCLVQDDDTIPRDSGWLDRALSYFDAYPLLAIVGGFMGFASIYRDDPKYLALWGETAFRFVHHVNIGPYLIRREHYLALGGWDYSFSHVGEPGICFDNELCLRAWLAGFQVGYAFVPFKGPARHYSEDGGTMLFSRSVRLSNERMNHQKLIEIYGGHAERIDELVEEANRKAGRGRDGGTGNT